MVPDATVNGTKPKTVTLGLPHITMNGASILKTDLNNSRGSSPQSISSSCSSTSDSTNFINRLDAALAGSPSIIKKKAAISETPMNFVTLTNGMSSRRTSASSISSSDVDKPVLSSSKNKKATIPASPVSSAPGTPDQNEKMDKGKRKMTSSGKAKNKTSSSSSISSTDLDISGSTSRKKIKLNISALQDLTSSPSTSAPSSPGTPADKIDKRKRCGVCSACQIPTCKKCFQCNNGKENYCVKRPKCERTPSRTPNSTPTTTPIHFPSITTPNKSSPSTTPKSGDKRKRCGECTTCIVPKCGTCTWCSKGSSGYCAKKAKCLQRPQHNLTPQLALTSKSGESPKRQRCKSCSGCMAPPCGKCPICIKKAEAEAVGKKLGYGICRERKCLAMIKKEAPLNIPRTPIKKIKIKNKRCGQCEGCKADPCGVCEAPVKEALNLSPEKMLRCGDCYECNSLECGSCTFCLKKAEAGGEDIPGICEKRKCLKKGKKAQKIVQKKCGTCEGCLAESCGKCGHCNGKFPQKCFQKRCRNTIVVPSEGGKKRRCKECPSCNAQECGECGHCKKKATLKPGEKMGGGICIKRKCENMIGGSAPKPKKIKKPKVLKPKGNSSKSVQRTARCGECLPCVAPDCGHCNACKINEAGTTVIGKIQCVTNNCLHPVALSGDHGRPSIEPKEEYVPPIMCEDCPGCSTKCGRCLACEGVGTSDEEIPPKCTERICYNNRQRRKPPPKHSGNKPRMLELMAKQDDSAGGTTIPIKIINGVAYDFRCTICGKLPRAGSANRSELMRHYSLEHFKAELKKEFGHLKKCPICHVDFKGSNISHMGQKHNEVVKYLNETMKSLCPVEIQGKSHNRRPRRMVMAKKRRRFGDILEWPELPDGFHPAAENRFYDQSIANERPMRDVMMKEVTIIRIGKFEIDLGVDDEEECIEIGVNSEIPDYTGVQGQCMVCNTLIDEVSILVVHLHQDHEIQGGSSHPMKDAQAFIEKGFIKPNENDDVKKLVKKSELIPPKSVAKKSTSQKKLSPVKDQSPEPIR